MNTTYKDSLMVLHGLHILAVIHLGFDNLALIHWCLDNPSSNTLGFQQSYMYMGLSFDMLEPLSTWD